MWINIFKTLFKIIFNIIIIIYVKYIMVHLSNMNSILVMCFYSFLTFFLGPLLTRPFMQEHPDQCVAGFLLGFTISILLWMKYGRKIATRR